MRPATVRTVSAAPSPRSVPPARPVVPTEDMLAAIDEETLIVPISHVFFRTSFMQDAPVASGVTQIPPLPMAELAGQITGDASGALGALESCAQGGVLVVACDKLVRVDFFAAGSILNWVAARQAEGCQVVFCNLHSLVAVFFGVIGINEHAKVLPRK